MLVQISVLVSCCVIENEKISFTTKGSKSGMESGWPLRWHGSHLAEVNVNINLGYNQDQGYS